MKSPSALQFQGDYDSQLPLRGPEKRRFVLLGRLRARSVFPAEHKSVFDVEACKGFGEWPQSTQLAPLGKAETGK